MGLSIAQINVTQPPLIVEDAFMPEEFETVRVMARDGLEKAINDDTVGLKKALSEKVELTVQGYIPTLTAPLKNCINETSPTYGPVINVSVDVCIEPAAKNIAKYSTEKCVEKGVKPALNASIDTCTKVAQKSTQKTVQSTQSIWGWFVSFVR